MTTLESEAAGAKWLAWLEKGRQSDLAIHRKIKMVAAIFLALAALSIAFYHVPRG